MAIGAGEYVREIEARFLELEGRGFALSAQDVGRVLVWHRDGVPLRIVLAALDEADRRRRAELTTERLTLGRLSRTIEAAMKRRVERVSAASPAVSGQDLLDPRDVSGHAVGGSAMSAGGTNDDWAKLAHALESASGEVGALAKTAVDEARVAGGDVWQAAEEVDRMVLDALLTRVPAAELAELEGSLPRADVNASPEARAERRRFLLGRALRKEYDLPELVGVLLGGGR